MPGARKREPILGGVQGPALGPLAGCRGRAPAGGPGGGAPGRFWIYAFQSTAYTHRYTIEHLYE